MTLRCRSCDGKRHPFFSSFQARLVRYRAAENKLFLKLQNGSCSTKMSLTLKATQPNVQTVSTNLFNL